VNKDMPGMSERPAVYAITNERKVVRFPTQDNCMIDCTLRPDDAPPSSEPLTADGQYRFQTRRIATIIPFPGGSKR